MLHTSRASLYSLIKHHALSPIENDGKGNDLKDTALALHTTVYENHVPHDKYYMNRISLLHLKRLHNETKTGLLSRQLISALYELGIGLPKSSEYSEAWRVHAVENDASHKHCVKELRKVLREHIIQAEFMSPDGIYSYGEDMSGINSVLSKAFLGKTLPRPSAWQSAIREAHGKNQLFHISPVISGIPCVLLYRYSSRGFKLYSAVVQNTEKNKENIPALEAVLRLNSIKPRIDESYDHLISKLGFKHSELVAIVGTLTIKRFSGETSMIKELHKFHPEFKTVSDVVHDFVNGHDLFPVSEDGFLKSEWAIKHNIRKKVKAADNPKREIRKQYEAYKKGYTLSNYVDFVAHDIFRYKKDEDKMIILDLDYQYVATHLQSLGFITLSHPLTEKTKLQLGTAELTENFVEEYIANFKKCSYPYKLIGIRALPNARYRVGASRGKPYIVKV